MLIFPTARLHGACHHLWLPVQPLITLPLLLCSSRFRTWLMTVWMMGSLLGFKPSSEPASTSILAATIHCFLASLTSHDTLPASRATASRLVVYVGIDFHLPVRLRAGVMMLNMCQSMAVPSRSRRGCDAHQRPFFSFPNSKLKCALRLPLLYNCFGSDSSVVKWVWFG